MVCPAPQVGCGSCAIHVSPPSLLSMIPAFLFHLVSSHPQAECELTRTCLKSVGSTATSYVSSMKPTVLEAATQPSGFFQVSPPSFETQNPSVAPRTPSPE